jgi:hypothetical protein
MIWKEALLACSMYYAEIFTEGLRKPRKTSLRIANVPAEIRTICLLNTSKERYRYTNPSGDKVLFYK